MSAVEAVEADVATILRNGTGTGLTKHKPVVVPHEREPLTVAVAPRQQVLWRDQLYYVVDADLDRPGPEDRHPVVYQRYAANELQLKLPDETRAALSSVHSVRVFYVDDFNLKIKRALLDLLTKAPAGSSVAQLWASDAPPELEPLPELPTAFALHPNQHHALAAMTSPGGWFVWGPPGTGKTTVITEAVRRALAEGLSVLIASHTHVAVDNVLEGIADPGSGVDFACGDVIRIASVRTEEKVSTVVREHEHLLLRKAAAVLNDTTERQQTLQQRMDANHAHASRLGRELLLQGLGGADAGKLERARQADAARDDLALLAEQRQAIDRELAAVQGRIAAHLQAAQALDVTESERSAARGIRRRARRARQALDERAAHALRERAAAQALAATLDEFVQQQQECADEAEERERIAATVSAADAAAILDEARRDGWLEQFAALASVDAKVDTLDRELEELRRARQAIEVEEAETRERLVREAGLVACTLAAYTLSPLLNGRRFDVVILDEASSITAPEVILAGSRADRTFAVVGDFLQNAPIAETDDNARGVPELHPWQGTDIFELAGIHDHDSALGHARCVALSSQHRFPTIIADVVNDFCYGGLLTTASSVVRDAGPVITLFDTSAHLDKRLVSDGSSWWCRLGLELLREVAQRPDLCIGSTLGFISPYRAQADQAARLRLRTTAGVPAECGTAHAFQGRQYDTVVVDLMQDDHPRWIGKADLHGTAHAIAAAKLLNVALTRTKRRLYLIGDWNFIRDSTAPGMRALAALEGHSDFAVVGAGEMLASANI